MKRKKVLFRADASAQIGSGHVMRCLTLADALRERSFDCVFACRSLPEQLARRVRDSSHSLVCLDHDVGFRDSGPSVQTETVWSAEVQIEDARQCLDIALDLEIELTVVDHYGLDIQWEAAITSTSIRVMVIDDLANRRHDCSFLLDQNLGRRATDYEGLVPAGAELMTGPRFALLRPEFATLRASSLRRRSRSAFRRLLISVGGADPQNLTGKLVRCLDEIELPDDLQVTVVLGALSPFAEEVRAIAQAAKRSTKVVFNVSNMAELMAESDLAIGAAGGTAWERCCLGMPSIVLVLSENQREGAAALADFGAALIADFSKFASSDIRALLDGSAGALALKRMSSNAASVCDGVGLNRVCDVIDV